MSILNQRTIKNSISFADIGLHTGKKVVAKVIPSAPNTGIIFKRTDLNKNNIVFPNVHNVSDANFCTTISNEHGVKVSTVEHLMAALFIKGIDNALIEINSEEVPIFDGSSMEFIKEIEKVGVQQSDLPIKIIKINKEVHHEDGLKKISVSPSKINLEIDFEIKYDNQFIGDQRNILKVYEDDLYDTFNSRTFCLYEDIEKLREAGFAKGGSLKNALVVKDNKLLNDDGLRNQKEFVNHKILDCMGDLFLSGYKIIGKVKCIQGGHKLTNDLLRKVFQNKENYRIVEINEKNVPHSLVYKQNLKSIA